MPRVVSIISGVAGVANMVRAGAGETCRGRGSETLLGWIFFSGGHIGDKIRAVLSWFEWTACLR